MQIKNDHASLPSTWRRSTIAAKYSYFLTFTTFERRTVSTDAARVEMVLRQFLRAATDKRHEVTAYCFMPDHVHLLVKGVHGDSDCQDFIKAAKQYSGYHFRQSTQETLWQRYGYERVLRDEMERATTIRYILDNPVNAGLAEEPGDYPFLGSACYSVPELLEQSAPRG
jgi:putative transposase